MAAGAAGVAATGAVRGCPAEAPVGGAGVDCLAPGATGAVPAGAAGGWAGRGGAAFAPGAAAGRPGMPGGAGVLPASGLGLVDVGGSRASVMRDVGWCASVLIPVPLVVPL
ncbi:hypothetical protein [Streptomyces sp. NBC_01353]|uniref:hypothetical protein n=1 Tax=Streptomyces sp. NBC_01353 TaxID=2903835 RepID=UPI002E3725CD|nr:hypothetical protein [Streptomyces sp. NBC_01353]